MEQLEAEDDIGHTVTVFGATGFLGRYIVNRLGMCDPAPGLEVGY
jgi:nucleoside-diphosphate-sugar epimerase